jgi:putative lumazine-binding protein
VTAALDTQDRSQVEAVATEYFQAWFAGDGERIRATLHPHLSKRRLRTPDSGSLVLHEDPTETLVEDTASGEGTSFEPTQEVIVCDLSEHIASVVVRSAPFVEYLHLAKFDDRWLIVNALYRVLSAPDT